MGQQTVNWNLKGARFLKRTSRLGIRSAMAMPPTSPQRGAFWGRFFSFPPPRVIAKIQQDGAPGIPCRGTIAPPIQERQGRGKTIIAESRRRFTQPRALVEERITKFLATASAITKKAHHRGW